jgi:hypothetical protein
MNAMFSLLFRFRPRSGVRAPVNTAAAAKEGSLDEFAARDPALACLLRLLLHGSPPQPG